MTDIHGPLTLYYDNEHLKMEGFFNHGLCHGCFTEYDRNGKIREIATFNEGLLHGTLYKWYADGSLKLSSQWFYGKPHGYVTSFYEDRSPMESGLFWYGHICYLTQYHPDGSIMKRESPHFLGIAPDDQYKYWYWVRSVEDPPFVHRPYAD
jgi:antitoxin component YwqK of YwqJK toxin-antitoxin module